MERKLGTPTEKKRKTRARGSNEKEWKKVTA